MVVYYDRSLMNVPFVCNIEDKEAKDAMEAKFIKEAAAAGFVNLSSNELSVLYSSEKSFKPHAAILLRQLTLIIMHSPSRTSS